MKGPLCETTKKIREAGMTVAGWARLHGFSPDYVRHVIGGRSGRVLGIKGKGSSGKIINQLKKDKFWVAPKKER